jgi:hypothetical protein
LKSRAEPPSSSDTFATNAASGELEFMDATNNTVWALVPPKLVPSGDTLSLLFDLPPFSGPV